MMGWRAHTKTRRAIRSHFGRGNSRAVEHAMFTHVSECASCREVYERYAALATVDPEAPPRSERLLRGLGLTEQRRRVSLWLPAAATAAAVSAAVLLLYTAPGARRHEEGFRARGGSAASPDEPELLVYRMPAAGAPDAADAELVVDQIHASDALAFAYRNPDGAPYLLVFARTAAGRLHWYYPAWTSPQDDPQAVALTRCSEPCELGEAVRHELHAGTLELVAVFVDRPWRVRQIEAIVDGLEAGTLLEVPGAEIRIRKLIVIEEP
jgi:hypothetical protein